MKRFILLFVFVTVCFGYRNTVRHLARPNQFGFHHHHYEYYEDYDDPEARGFPDDEPDRQPEEKCELTALPPSPDSLCCGVDSVNPDRIIGGTQTLPQHYPWLALIEYKNKKNKTVTLCGAVLISGRYALTAAHCVMGEVLDHGTPINVRLGEHNSTNEGQDCVILKDGKTCNDGAIRIAIEDIIVHKEHKHSNVTNVNDIALIRLKQNAPYTDFIRPICLPNADITVNPQKNVTLYTAGWGAKSQTKVFDWSAGGWTFWNEYSDVKLHVDLPLRNIEACKETYSFLNKNHICAGGVEGKDACRGDSGGPLMYEKEGIYDVVGLVSFGAQKCAVKGNPGVYTNVFQFIDWIRSNIKS